jgi:hypothetical protein
MKIKLLVSLVFSLAFLISASNVSAETYTYKWKSADGEVHYTERPPAVGIPFTKIRVKDDTRKGQAQNTLESSASEKAANKKDDAYKGWREDNCKIANQNLDVLENSGRISTDDGQGGTRLMTDEERKAKLDKMKAQKEKYCSEDTP